MQQPGHVAERRTQSPQDEHFVLLRAGGHDLAVPVADIQEIVHYAELASPPSLPAFVKGFLNLDGNPVAVIDVALLFNLQSDPVSLYSPIVILRSAEQSLAMLVESVHAVARFTPDAVLPVPPDHALGDCAIGSINWSDHLHSVLNVHRLLLREETQRIAELSEIARERLAHVTEVLSCKG